MMAQVARLARAVPLRHFSSTAGTSTIVYDPVSHIVSSPFTVELSPLNLPDYLWRNLSSVERKPAITCGLTGRSYTYSQLFNTSQNFGANLKRNLGLKNEDVVALVLPNLPEFSIAFYGAAAAGLVTTFANPIYTDVELGRHFSSAGARAVVTIPLLKDKVRAAMEKVPGGIGPLIMITPKGSKLEKDEINFDDWIEKKVRGTEELLKKPDAAQLVALPFSSGTTGVPKGVMLTHANLVSNLCQIDHPDFSGIDDKGIQTRSLAIIPFFHIYGLNAVLNSGISRGFNVISLPKFEPDSFVAALKNYQPTLMSLVPPLIAFLAKSPTVTREHLKSLQIISNGAATCPVSVIQELNDKLEGEEMEYKEGYGLTEVSCVAAMSLRIYDKTKEGSVGLVAPMAQFKVVDADGQALPLGERGELLFKGPNVMQGYWKNLEATNETLTRDGWLRTGDVAYIDSDGYVFLVDRLKELIKVKGYQVSPTELEEELRNIDGIADVAVIGVTDKADGEVPKAFVVKKAGAEVTEQQISEFLKGRVVEYKYLKGGVSFVLEIPRSSAGKIERKVLKNL